MKQVNVGIIGLGARAETLLASIFALKDEARVTAICDLKPERIQKIQGIFERNGVEQPAVYHESRLLLKDPQVDCVLAPTSWNAHLKIAADSLRAGKYIGIEVGGASSADELWQLVHASEETGVSCMLLENCCYGRDELMVLNMVRKGLFGELIFCTCGYEHDLNGEFERNPAERILHNIRRCGDLYPTHGLGPVAKILRINRGNRFLSLSSYATKARVFEANRAEHEHFNEGDIVHTVIKCANGEIVTLTHGVSLPRPYSRDGRVQGTKGIYLEDRRGIYVEGLSTKLIKTDVAGNPYDVHEWDPVEKFYGQYDHPVWKDYAANPVGGHGGKDALALRAFFDAVRRRVPTPIDVYDTASWMCVTCLSEQSIALGGAPVPFPDFTNGKWVDREKASRGLWSLDEIPE